MRKEIIPGVVRDDNFFFFLLHKHILYLPSAIISDHF